MGDPSLRLKSGCAIACPLERLRWFCDEEYSFYDAIPSIHPDRVEVVDVALTTAVNGFVNTAERLRDVHRGLSEACDPILARIPTDADLSDRDAPVDQLQDLLHAAVQKPFVLLPVATKVLHRKRPAFIPMLDQVILNYYLEATDRSELIPRTQDPRRAVQAARVVVEAFRRDLIAVGERLDNLRLELRAAGFELTRVRVLDILVWTEKEPRRSYWPVTYSTVSGIPGVSPLQGVQGGDCR